MITRGSSRARHRAPSPYRTTLSYRLIAQARCFGVTLSPVHYRRRVPRPVSYYALFKWWLLLSQHPGCHRNPTSFRTERDLGTLAGGLGCSPLDDEAYPSPSICRCCLLVFGVWFRWIAG